MNKKIGVCLLSVCLLTACENAKDLPLLGRYVAKNVCAAVWLEGYDEVAAKSYVSNIAPLIQASWKVSVEDDFSVSVDNYWFPWLTPKTASLDQAGVIRYCRNDYAGVQEHAAPAPLASSLSAGFINDANQDSALQRYLDAVIAVGEPEHTTAMLVLYQNRVVAEAYRDGIDATSPLKGYSMSKSFANLLVGRSADKKRLSVTEPMLLDGWELDQRAPISWDNSLRMSTGLQWHEAAVGDDNDQGQMFYNAANPSDYARTKPFAAEPNTGFNYSSGDFMNVSTALTAYNGWFDPGWDLGQQFTVEFSPNGQYPLLAEGVYLTTRGWAALASIYMNGGELAGQPVLSAQWVNYSLTPSDTNYDYGAGIWLNHGLNLFPGLPEDTFAFIGSYDRYVVALPSSDVVIVRFGFSSQPNDFDMQRFVQNVLELVPQ